MKVSEAVDEITSEVKYYIGIIYKGKPLSQSKASRTVQNIRNGSASRKTIAEFLNSFGYREVEEDEWVKIEYKVEKPQLKYS